MKTTSKRHLSHRSRCVPWSSLLPLYIRSDLTALAVDQPRPAMQVPASDRLSLHGHKRQQVGCRSLRRLSCCRRRHDLRPTRSTPWTHSNIQSATSMTRCTRVVIIEFYATGAFTRVCRRYSFSRRRSITADLANTSSTAPWTNCTLDEISK